MYLLIDIGNSRAKGALSARGEITVLPELSSEIVQQHVIEGVYYASVAHQDKVEQLKASLLLEHIPWVQIKSVGQSFGVTNSYQQPALLGADRWLALLGAAKLYPAQNVLIIDAGTAVTADWLGKDGKHLGGWILPGLKLMQQSVTKNTAQVFNSEQFSGLLQPGVNTVSCLQNGCLAAVLGAIKEGWQLQQADKLILTGGDAEYLKPHLQDLPVYSEPLLLFYGLARYLEN